MIQILFRDAQGRLDVGRTTDDLPALLKEPGGLLWMHVTDMSAAGVERILSETFRFHPLAIDDALVESHVPKVDDWGDYVYVVLRAVRRQYNEEGRLHVPELDVFLSATYMVTYSAEPLDAVQAVWDVCLRDERWTSHGSGHLLYRLIDELVSDMVSAVEHMQEELEVIEDKLFAGATQNTLESLFTLKRNVLLFRRIVIPQRDVLGRLARNGYAAIDEADQVFFRDVYDHLVHLDDLLDDLLILVAGGMDTYLSIVNNRLNDIMKTLTVITALFMPLAFVTGFFGMNFFAATESFSEWTGTTAFIIVVGGMLLVPGAMFWWMRRRAWI